MNDYLVEFALHGGIVGAIYQPVDRQYRADDRLIRGPHAAVRDPTITHLLARSAVRPVT